MKILHISDTDLRGGASIAAFEIHKALLSQSINSTMVVQKKFSSCNSVHDSKSTVDNILRDIKIAISRKLVSYLKTDNKSSHSLNLFGSSIIKKIKVINPDIVHLHWINNETLSIKDICKIDKKIVWTTHDMWPFCGAEHYTNTDRFMHNYSKLYRPSYEKGFDINFYIWKKKISFLKKNITFVCPSNWILMQLKNSAFKKLPSYKIAHPISQEWKPYDKISSRNFLSLPIEKDIILFGSERGGSVERKGFDILHKILSSHSFEKKTRLVVFGGDKKEIERISDNFEIQYLGHFYDRNSMRLLYSAADICAVPSLQEAFGLICAEAQGCGLPCIAFEDTGLADLILHKKTGYLAKSNNYQDFLLGINWLLEDNNRLREMSLVSHEYILNNYNQKKIADQYTSVYRTVLNFS
jgi:glycosyltransferase involved in cell wall biosynthesis